jgi:NAD(P)-dependent dehydrogenase (short-subunit alcohol dehydrogenase family)
MKTTEKNQMKVGSEKDNMPTEHKIAFITGANRGLGLETARGLGQLGITVLLGSRDRSRGEKAAAELRADGVACVEPVVFDLQNRDDHRALAAMIEENYGRLDILVNNAAVEKEGVDFGNPDGFNTTSTVSQEALQETFDINFFSVVALTQTLLPLIRRSPAGRIVNLSSILGSLTLHAEPSSSIYKTKAFAYDATKRAINAFTVHLAAELRDTPIKVNSAHPGWVKTELGGAGANLDITEGGNTSVQLATLSANGPTGAYIHLDQKLPW